MSLAVDPITVSVIQHRLRAIVEEMGEAMLRTVLLADPELEPRFLDRAVRSRAVGWSRRPSTCRSTSALCRWRPSRCTSFSRADPPRRRLPAQRSLSRRQPSARSHGVRAGLRRRPAGVLVDQPLAPERHRRRHARRLQRQRDRDLPGGHPHHRRCKLYEQRRACARTSTR